MQDNSRHVVETSAETWGQLKAESSQVAKMSRDMKVTIKENRTTIESDDSLLPDTECTLFLFAAKVKAGGLTEEKLIEDYAATKANELVDATEKDLDQIEEQVLKLSEKK